MKYFSLILYVILILTSAISNVMINDDNEYRIAVSMITSLHFGSIVFYFISRISDEKTLVMLTPKYFYCFSISYKHFVFKSLFNLIFKRIDAIPLYISPFLLFFSGLPLGKSMALFVVLTMISIYSLTVQLLLFQWSFVSKLEINFKYVMILLFVIPFHAAYKLKLSAPLILNPFGTFLSAPLFFNDRTTIFLVLLAQFCFLSLILFGMINRGLKQWPTY